MKIFPFILFIIYTNSVFAEKLTNRECNEIASDVNNSMSDMQIDEITILKNTFCLSGANLRYNYELDSEISKSEFKDVIPLLKNPNINTWCSTPELKNFIVRLDSVGYRYYKKNGEYLGMYEFTDRSCR